MSPPEFSIICRTHGGPATKIVWSLAGLMQEHIESHQIILNTLQNCTYENRLLVRGRYSGTWTCTVSNTYIRDYFPKVEKIAVHQSIQIRGMTIIIVYVSLFFSTDMYSCW